MSDKDRIKNASHNVIDLMSKFGKQFLSEAIDQGEPIIDLINNITKSNEEETKNSNNLKKKERGLILMNVFLTMVPKM